MCLTILGHPVHLFSPFSPTAAVAEGGQNAAGCGWTGCAAETNNICGHWFTLHLSVLNCMKMPFAGGEIDCVDKDGNTPLHVAARYGHELLINTLITSGADTAK